MQLGPGLSGRLEVQPEKRGYRPTSPGHIATLPEARQAQELCITIKQLEAEEQSQFKVEGDKLLAQTMFKAVSLRWR